MSAATASIGKTARSIAKTVVGNEQAEGVGARVFRTIGTGQLRSLDPFLMLDEFFVSPPAGFSDHPHRGIETITRVYEGAFEHEDFKGHKGRLGPGDMQWMTAGRGIVHAEVPAVDGVSRGLQLWVNLPKSHKLMEPRYQELKGSDIPQAHPSDGVVIQVIAGKSFGVQAPVKTVTPIMYLDVVQQANTRVEHAIPANYSGFVYVMSGSAKFGAAETEGRAHSLLVLDAATGKSEEETTLPVATSDDKGCQYVLLGGEPIGEPIAQHGPFVMTTQDELRQAFMDFHRGVNGFEGAHEFQSDIAKRVGRF
ncbi:RNA pol II transcription cofactor [Sorochytrium milnesiophthora]